MALFDMILVGPPGSPEKVKSHVTAGETHGACVALQSKFSLIISKKRSSRLVEKEVEESPEIETTQANEVVDPVVEEEVEEEEEVPLIRRSSKKPATAKSTTTKSTTPKITTKAVTSKSTAKTAPPKITKTTTPKKPVTLKSKAPSPKPVEESKPEESEKMEESESDKESEPGDVSEPQNQEMEEEEVEKEEVVIVEKVVAQKPSSKAVKSVEKPVPKPIPTKPSIKTTKPKISTPTIAPQPVEKSKKKSDADVEGEVPKKETVKAGASKGPRIKTVARKDAESSKGKEIMEQELEFPADKKRKGTPINLSEKSLAEILKVPHKGLDEYSRENWPTVKGLTAEQIRPGGVLKMKSAAKGAAIGEGTSTESVQATYALVKQLSDQNQMMQNMLNSATQLCTDLQESYKRVEIHLDKAGIQGREDSEEKDESSHAAGTVRDQCLEFFLKNSNLLKKFSKQ
ncbi:uncharacterized protein LOC130591141 [Beta vulgaris subsp. vulgaris]|uniref:uncharacterized protein LOC130591141 n=1 Tax=Beta vulgaris subsp. vulgaris TaxID=3555 RepID=UPI002548095F|nr:uncharacterized protein LOC130591141 [Beta vulgaris subsp. vulgaris]